MENRIFSRPKRTDSEQEILEMQKAFLTEKNKNTNFQPAAQALRVDKGKKQSLFAQNKSTKDTEKQESKPSDISKIILGDIVEKPTPLGRPSEMPTKPDLFNELGFPKAEKITVRENVDGKSLFLLSLERKRQQNKSEIEVQEDEPKLKSPRENFGEKSMIVENSETAKQIHEENVELLCRMKKEAVLAERAKLLQTLDPNMIEFLKEKRKKQYMKQCEQIKSEIEAQAAKKKAKKELSEPSILTKFIEGTPALELLNEGAAEKWIHFDVIEKEKLEWMKDVSMKVVKLKPGKTFEARFDWKGVLLPYSENNVGKDDRELYLHGDEPHRPGYTLQELFRLSRSCVIQQRITAFESISGILNVYNQGFYDNVLELPISKIFFLLRFGLDENISSLLEVVSKGLSMLFYNDTDETILDLIAETSEGYLQPKMEVDSVDMIETSTSENLEKHLQKLRLTSSPFSTKVEESEEEIKTSMTDFHIAETDLIECLLRTNIIQRITYILGMVKPKNSTVLSCLKILIRIARTNKDAGLKITFNDDLMNSIFTYFLPGLEQIDSRSETNFYFYPQHLALKLLRILMCQHLSLCVKILNMNIIEKIKNYLFTREDMKAKLIKVQIESLRTLRAIMMLKPDISLYREFLPAFRYMLEWHYQHIIYEKGGPFLIRQHAAALLNCISSASTATNEIKNLLGEGIFICCCKWFYDATRFGVEESTILSSCLNCVAWYIQSGDQKFKEFIEKYLKPFVLSKSFLEFIQNLRFSSILSKEITDRRNVCPALPNLGSVLVDNSSPQLIIFQLYPVYFLNNLLKIIEYLNSQKDTDLIESLMQPEIIDSLLKFLTEISLKANQQLAMNFLSKSEIKLVFKLLRFNEVRTLLSKETLLQLTYKILCCMTSEHVQEVEVLFDLIIFNEQNLSIEQNRLSHWKRVYLEAFVYPHRHLTLKCFQPPTEISLSMPCSKFGIFPNDWPYWLLKSLLNDCLQQVTTGKVKKDSDFSEVEILSITLTFTSLLQNCGLQVTSPTEELMYLMMAFMGQESHFLEPNMKSLLQDRIVKFFNSYKDLNFDFEEKFEGKSKFENLYVLFLDQFQAASYGDDLFSALVMVPLSQKYDCKWRKMVWSEHASVLRFLNCTENQLLGSLYAYLYPIETDFSLIKCYAQALNSNLLRVDSIPYKIAKHHVNNFKKNETVGN